MNTFNYSYSTTFSKPLPHYIPFKYLNFVTKLQRYRGYKSDTLKKITVCVCPKCSASDSSSVP